MTVLRTKPEQERRFKILHLPFDSLLETMLTTASLPGDCVRRISFEDVDEGTEVVDRFYDHQWQSEAVLLYNPNWPSVGFNETVPIIQSKVVHVVVDLRVPREQADCTQPLSKQIGVFLHAGQAFRKFRESLEKMSKMFQKLQSEPDETDENGFPLYGSKLEEWMSAHGVTSERLYIKYRKERMAHFQGVQAIYVLTYQGWKDAKHPSPFDPMHDHPDYAAFDYVIMHPPDVIGVFEASVNGVVVAEGENKIVTAGIDEILDWKVDRSKPGFVASNANGDQIALTDPNLMAKLTETPSLDSLLDKFSSMEDIRPKGDPIVTDTVAGEPAETWRNRKPLL